MNFSRLLLLATLIVSLGACAGLYPVDYAPSEAERLLDERVEILLADLISDRDLGGRESVPAAIVPGSAIQGEYFSRLEEILCERLQTRLREAHDIFQLTRQNWFELRAGHALSFQNLPQEQRRRLTTAIIYQVEITADTVLDRINATITARDAEGRSLSGVVASGPLGFGRESLARQLYYEAANRNPFPEGLEERPFSSLDRLAYSLTSELSESYANGLQVAGQTVSDREIKVLLHTGSSSHLATGLNREIQEALQQALISRRGFTCVLSHEDFSAALQQIDFYQWHAHLFKTVELPQFEVGTVLLLADLSQATKNGVFSLALRALWRTNPLEDQSGALVVEDAGGTYVSGFTAKAYFSGENLRYRYNDHRPAKAGERRLVQPLPEKSPLVRKPWDGPSQDLNLCFYDFTETLAARIYPVLNQAPGVTWLRRADELCERNRDCLCYEIWYNGSMEDMTAWLTQYLRTSKSINFNLRSYGPGRLEVHFDGGFN
ncbi:MAG: hypothetical protein JXR89_09035 [Deltaproteobacteria bacterium]|nr:hypothetical protein [Deltaproteobacteria bacterium]